MSTDDAPRGQEPRAESLTPGAVPTLLALIAQRLGAADPERAVDEARRRGLIM